MPYTNYASRQQNYSSASATRCRIQWDEDVDAYIVSTPYSPQFVEFIKLAIPVSDRAWHQDTKVWYVKEAYFQVLCDVAKRVWPLANEVTIVDKATVQAHQAAQQAQQQSTNYQMNSVAKAKLDFVMAEFVSLLPNDALKAAYRAAATALHPDKNNNDGTKMSRLNELWTRIKQDKAII